jgi:O-antigen/teichoic acid export membrane protein
VTAAPNLRQRLVTGVQAQVAGLGVRTLVQIGTVSILAGTWGLDLYGEWLILAAAPAYVAVSDIGFFAAGSNAMIMRVAGDDRWGALRVFQAVSAAVAVLFGAVVVALLALVTLAPLSDWLNLDTISESSAAWILVTLGLNALVASYANFLYGGFASVGRYGEGAFVLAGITLLEFCALAAIVLLGGGPRLAATAMFATRLPSTMAMYVLMRRHAPWLRFGRPVAMRRLLRPLITPALASGAFPAAFALNVQGMVVLIGVALGPASAAIFSTLRMMSRIIVQVLTRVFAVISPELSMAFARGDLDRVRSIHRRGCQAAVWLAAPVLVVLGLFGDSVIRIWTSGAVDAQGPLLYLFLAVAALNSLWATSLAVMFARNRHQRLAVYYLLASAACLPIAYALLDLWGLDGAAVSLIALEVFMLFVTLRQTVPAAHDTLRGWLTTVLSPPPIRALRAALGTRSETVEVQTASDAAPTNPGGPDPP